VIALHIIEHSIAYSGSGYSWEQSQHTNIFHHVGVNVEVVCVTAVPY